ncbi:Uncharacterised protein [Streptococcus pneumoniae]|uniref:hypothetical protein n=1 Tax=Streptococcus pneumoniae TaxID=1313 RepID=UPI0010705AED|nr:hypothetical protein [Streptococcus pneumoniae]VGM75322.1 Uncharacterised protein [Streptococcus pneumoniae]VQW03120.1 Uncharacterised protein [Streptococcus pneumoniae]
MINNVTFLVGGKKHGWSNLDGLKRTIEQNEEKIIEYSKPCDARKRRIRALERDLLKKKNKELRKKVEELEDEI